MSPVPHTTEELWRLLAAHLRFIGRSFKRVIEGDEFEALRVAMSIRVLLHDVPGNQNSISLLTQLELKDKLQFLDSRSYASMWAVINDADPNQAPDAGLAVPVGFPPRWTAPLDQAPHDRPPLTFEEWWQTPVVPPPEAELAVTRGDLVRTLANKAGGGHVDVRGVTRQYDELARRGSGTHLWSDTVDLTNGPPEKLNFDDMQTPLGNAAAMSMVQMGWEVIWTVTNFPDCSRLRVGGDLFPMTDSPGYTAPSSST